MDLFIILIAILIFAVIVRGPKTLPQIGSVFGRGVREARRQAKDLQKRDDGAPDEAAPRDA